MRTFLNHDETSGELWLVMTDLWNGLHERTEWRVINNDGSPVRRGQAFDGLAAIHDSFGQWRVKYGPAHDQRTALFTVEYEPQPTKKTVCRRLASKSKRAKCVLCDID